MINRRKILALAALGIGAFALVHYWPRRPVEIIPCVTSIDNADFNDPKKMEEFIQKSVPLGTGISCMKRVMSGKKFNPARGGYINEKDHSVYAYFYREKSRLRFYLITSVGYDQRQVSFFFTNGKLQRKVVH